MAEVVDGNYFALAGVATVLGRGLMAHDDRPDSSLVAVISQPFARDWFGSSSSPIGQHLALNGTTFTVVGVTTALGSSSFLGASVDVWVPLAHADALLNRGWRTNVDERWFTTYALPTGGAGEVEARLAAAASALTRRYPDTWRDRRLRTIAGTIIAGSQRRAAIVVAATLSALAALILVVAAANLGGLLLAHAAADKRAAAIHLSLGCGRRALARRLLIEGAALGMIASILAVGGYAWTRMWFANIALFPTLALRLELARPSSVALWALVGGLFLGAALAVGPAFWAMRIDPAEALRDAGSRAIGNRGLARTRRVMVALQVAVSLVLVVGAALFTRSLAALVNVDVGFERSRLIAMDFDVEPSSVPQSALPALAREAVARVSALPGITNVAMSNRAPIDPSTPTVEVQTRPGAPPVGDVSIYLATPGYFEAIGLPLLSGRSFSQAEAERNADVVIVNQTLGARLWPHDDAVDRVLTLVDGRKTLRVVGVARDSKYRALGEPPRPHIYRPTAPALSLTLLARTAGDPYESLRAIQQALDGVGPGLVGFFPRTLTDHVAVELLPTRAAAAAAQWIGALALLFSCVGLYGLVSWFVELRRREIGIRMALGASARDVRALIVKHSLQAALPGTIGGLLMSVALARLSRAALFGVGPLDLAAFGAALAAIVIVVAGASYVPSRRATRVDPAMTLRLP
jgi:predicted permease